MNDHITFDQFAGDYDAALAAGISATGEDKDYFARGRIAWLAGCLNRIQERPKSAIDFGCGTGAAAPHLLDLLGLERVTGVDNSPKIVEVAQSLWGSERATFLQLDQFRPAENFDLAFCNGVFHHIPVAERAAAVKMVSHSLRPGGLFALWENNPWNPGTRYVMSKIPFDRDAITLTPPETRLLLRDGGFQIISTDFLFIFPRTLRWFRGLEPMISKLPLGGQYQVLCRKP